MENEKNINKNTQINIKKTSSSPEERREKNNKYIQELGITCLKELPLIEESSKVKLKDIDTICKRAIACLITIDFDFNINDLGYEKARKIAMEQLENYSVQNSLINLEKRLYNNDYNDQVKVDIVWSYECYWSLVWALGLIDNIKDADSICDCEKALSLVYDCSNYSDFKNKCKIRDIEEILDMLDLYYRYHWACEDKRINPNTSIGSLNEEVVWERRRGLEWLISKEEDWNEISLDT